MIDEKLRNASIGKDLLIGMAGGLLASFVVGGVDKALDHVISAKQRARERLVRRASPHEIAQEKLAGKVSEFWHGDGGERAGKLAFTALYGMGWGLVYALARRKAPALAKAGGLPFAVPFFFLCDGLIAPFVKLTPPLRKIPWQPNAKEFLNHAAWTATAEMAFRGAGR